MRCNDKDRRQLIHDGTSGAKAARLIQGSLCPPGGEKVRGKLYFCCLTQLLLVFSQESSGNYGLYKRKQNLRRNHFRNQLVAQDNLRLVVWSDLKNRVSIGVKNGIVGCNIK